MKLSIIIPVYQTRNTLKRCVDSILTQDFRDWQMILVDDASTDGSAKICESYAKKEGRIQHVRLKRNSGLSAARNAGLAKAKGDYICMLDSDDWYGNDALEKAVDVFESNPATDVVLFQFMYVFPDHEQLFPSKPFTVIDGRTACQLSLDWQIHGIYMVRRAIHMQYPYDDTCRLFSDENTTRLHYAVSREIRYCEGTYYYRQHEASMSHRPSVRQFDKLKAKESLIKSLQELSFDVQ